MTEVTKQKFSVAMSVYKNDTSIDFVDAVLSIFNQTLDCTGSNAK